MSKIGKDHDNTKESVLLCSARSFMWPDESSLVMEVRVARSVLESELLVQEDEEFLNNFILNEEVRPIFFFYFEYSSSHVGWTLWAKSISMCS